MAKPTDWIQEYREVGVGKHRFKIDKNYVDMYKYYKDTYAKKVDVKLYKKLCLEFNMKLSDKIITDSLDFKMPYKLGNLRVRGKKQPIKFKDGKVDTRAMGVDWASSKKMWKSMWPDKSYKEIMDIPDKKLLVYTNDHSNGYIMKFIWDRRLANIKNGNVYVFKPVKGVQEAEHYEDPNVLYYGRRGLASWIKNDERTNEYFE